MPKLSACLILLLFAAQSMAASLEVNIINKQGRPLANAAVQLIPPTAVTEHPIADVAIMDQVKKQFLPHILVVQKNTQVRFPNSDSIKHHVYSFSPAKIFELQLYKGLNADPLMFSKTGVAELGCNVHDWMLGYIYVVDTPYFSKTTATGKASIEAPAGEYQIKIWHPRIQDPQQILVRSVNLADDSEVTFTLTADLLPGNNEFEAESDEFDDYD